MPFRADACCNNYSSSCGHVETAGDLDKLRMAKLHDPASLQCCGFKGVTKVKSGKFQAKLFSPIHKDHKYLGTYLDADEAAKAVDTAKIFLV